RTAEQDTCLHLLAHQWYGDHTRAGELLRLNPGLRNPNVIRKGDRLHAYSR
ncbi:multidrug DMT transporter permease, partial [Salmonella enterica]|nr:multidrug DMT transporter permease [Salmonella enterica]EGJ4183667.1 multidrug DMT transporter permease [Salmonella enterica]EIP4006512.1 multidrug DMT transporter permease [Salmonella enterica]EJH2145487.1 multidrug DMT transporter permease [Salmonella enterica]ELO5683461.1 multidrug DMT transporter permease [Salmonella enterica]